MASPDDDESISLLGEALEKLMATEDWQPDEPVQMGGATEFQRYMNLPAELREMIRIEAFIQQESSKQFAACAAVCKAWQPIVEKRLFRSISIDPMNEQDATMFVTVFTQERRRWLLSDLLVIIDDQKTGPWYSVGGLLPISLLMEKLGQILWFVNTWNSPFYRSLPIKFVSRSTFDPDKRWMNEFQTSSLWTESHLNRVTNSGYLPTNMPMWAIRSEFPAPLNFAEDLTLPIDCLPLPAAIALVQTMPNLTFCRFELTFEMESPLGLASLINFIEWLPMMAPNLVSLHIKNADDTFAPDTATDLMRRLTDSLRDYSQRLSSLRVENLRLHQSFFEPFADEYEFDMSQSNWKWPDMDDLKISFGTFGAYAGPGDPSQTPVELLIAAGRATRAMPSLTFLTIQILEGRTSQWETFLCIGRHLDARSGKPVDVEASLQGFDRDEDEQILAALEPFMGGKARFVESDDDEPPMREYVAVPEFNRAR